MKKSILFFLVIFALVLSNILTVNAIGQIQKVLTTISSISTDTVYYVDFKRIPGSFTQGDIFTASTSNEDKETTINGIVFGAGPNGQRINMNPSQSASQYGSGATAYVSATADDDGATNGAFSFLKTGTGSAAGGYIILPETQGPSDITIWACGANTGKTQSYTLYVSDDNGTTWSQIGSASFTDLKMIHKNQFSYTGNKNIKLKLLCTTGSSSYCNLYIYNVLITKRPSLELTSAPGTENQTIFTAANESVSDIVYTWGSIATTANISWTGTQSADVPPTGITVLKDSVSKTLTISGTPTVVGTYTYSVLASGGNISTEAFTGTINVVNSPVPLIKLTSASGTNIQEVTAGNAIAAVEYIWGGSAFDASIAWTGTASATTAPDGIVVTKDSLNEKMTIEGTPTVGGTYGWSIVAKDSIASSSALTGTLTVVPSPTVSFASGILTENQTVAYCNQIKDIVLDYGGSATSASISWTGTPSSITPPPGINVSDDTSNKTLTISGMPYLTGDYGFSVTSTNGTLTSEAITGSIISSSTAKAIVSFPGAVGYGSHATGGRNGTVYHVTNLNDSGAGSFRDAVSSSNRIIVFDVSGIIDLKSAVSCRSNLTIAGQTALGEGILFRGGEISFAKQQNIICRDIRIVPGSETASNSDDALSLYLARNVIMDHCTFEFAPWNNIDGVSDNYTVYPVTAITIQHCIDADPIYQQFGAHCESVLSQWTFYRNLFANSHNRNPLAKINDEFINNVEYNNEAGYTTHTGSKFKHDIVNNYFIWGPASGSNMPWFQIDSNQSIYYPGDLNDNNLDGELNGTTTTPYWYSGTGTILSSAWSPLTSLIPTVDAPSAYRTVLSSVGTQPLCQLDSIIINQVKTLGKGTPGYVAGTTGPSSGLYTNQTQTGLSNNGYGIIRSGVKATDTDNDGMPDFWEIATGSNPDVDDAMQLDSTGYTLIEDYLNWLAEPHAIVYYNHSVDVDLNQYCGGFSSVSPTYSISNVDKGSAVILADGHSVRFTPLVTTGIGSFKFTVKGSDGTSYSNVVSIVLLPENLAGVTKIDSKVSVYPNPANQLVVVLNSSASSYKLFDTTGKMVLSGLMNSDEISKNIDIEGLKTGVYFLKLIGDGHVENFKVMKK